MKKLDLKILLNYSDKWIATKGNPLNIVASGNSIEEVEIKLKEKKIKGAILTYITLHDQTHHLSIHKGGGRNLYAD